MILKGHPLPLRKRFIAFALLGLIFWLVGLSLSLFFDDSVMIILSLVICVCSFIKAACHYVVVKNNEYETVSGICAYISPIALRKQRKIKIIDDEGNEITLLLAKNQKITIGSRYNFYFKNTKRISIGSAYFDSVLNADCFLGYEETATEDEINE